MVFQKSDNGHYDKYFEVPVLTFATIRHPLWQRPNKTLGFASS
jgi:hypothetical protein